jgi:membrane peptidoglycan carboxypeptidase
VDNATGGIIALYGGPDFVARQWNWATNPRPTGSTMKMYALTAALRNGWTLNDKLNGNSFTPRGDSAPVHNADGNHGTVTLQTATTHSINSAFVDLVTQIPDGPIQVQTAAVDAGVPADGHWDLSNRIPLGNSEISPVNQANAFATIANQGVRHRAHVIAEVFDNAGKSLFKGDTNGEQTIEQDVATDVAYALTKVTQDGTGYRASQLGYPVAGKTGSAYYKNVGTGGQKMVAAWFVGFTRQISTAVMYVKGQDGTDDLGAHFFGSTFPLSTWLEYMRTAMDGKEKLAFDPPTNRVSTQTPTAKPKPTVTATPTPTAPVTPTGTAPPSTEPPTTAPPSTQPPTTAPPSDTGTPKAP